MNISPSAVCKKYFPFFQKYFTHLQPSLETYSPSARHLVEPPHVAVLVLLVLALDDLHLGLHRLLMEHGAHQVRHEPVQRVQEVLLGDVEVEVCVGGGSEGVVAAPLETEEMTEALVWK